MSATMSAADSISRSSTRTAPGNAEGKQGLRHAKDQIARVLMWTAFGIALVPLVWILGATLYKGGHMLLNPEWWTHSQLGITARRLMGAGFVPEERHGHAAVPGLPLSDNLVLARSQSDRKTFLAGGILGIIRHAVVRLASRRKIGRAHV